jgi:uncharacterized protein
MELTDNSTRNTIERFYQLLSSRDFATIASLFSETPDWHIPGNENLAPWLGSRNSREEIITSFHLLFANIEPVTAKVHHIFIDGNQAIATGEFASKMLKTGKIYQSPFFAHFTLKDHQIAKYRFLEDTLALVEALK